LDGGIVLESAVIDAINELNKDRNKQAKKNEAQNIIAKMKGK
jgi:hypothetical protein